MVRWRAIGWLVACSVAAWAGCQAIAGVEDRSLDPATQSATNYARRPPERPATFADAGPSGKGETKVFASRLMYVGTIDPASNRDDDQAWRAIGYDIDGVCTSREDSIAQVTGVCKANAKSQPESQEDGSECRDNAAGHLLALSSAILPDRFERAVHSSILDGSMGSLLLVIEDLDPGPDDPYAPGKLYIVRSLGTPTWDGKDDFGVDTISVNNNDINQPKYQFPRAFVKDNIWINGDFNKSPGAIPLVVLNRIEEIQASSAILTLRMDSTHDYVEDSVLSVVSPMAEFADHFRKVMVEATCSTFEAELATQLISVSSDLVTGAPNFVSVDAPCDAMSLGVRLEWYRTKPVQYVVPSPVSAGCDGGTLDGGTDARADGGADGSLDASHADGAPDAPGG